MPSIEYNGSFLSSGPSKRLAFAENIAVCNSMPYSLPSPPASTPSSPANTILGAAVKSNCGFLKTTIQYHLKVSYQSRLVSCATRIA